MPCAEGETVKMYTFMATFIAVFNLCLFFLPFDVMNSLFDVICTFQMFRAY